MPTIKSQRLYVNSQTSKQIPNLVVHDFRHKITSFKRTQYISLSLYLYAVSSRIQFTFSKSLLSCQIAQNSFDKDSTFFSF